MKIVLYTEPVLVYDKTSMDLLLKASALAETQMRRAARRFVISCERYTGDQDALVNNLKVFIKLNGSGSATRLCEDSGLNKSRLSEVLAGKRAMSLEMARRIAGLK